MAMIGYVKIAVSLPKISTPKESIKKNKGVSDEEWEKKI